MRLIIDTAENGYVLSYKDDDRIYKSLHVNKNDDNEDLTAIKTLLNEIADLLGHFGSRYDSERLFIGLLPGDKYEGKLTKNVKETLELIKYRTEGLEDNE